MYTVAAVKENLFYYLEQFPQLSICAASSIQWLFIIGDGCLLEI